MDNRIEKVLTMWHEHFSHAENQYSEFESSDIEYFVGCMLYNHFAFSKALETMKTMDLSYDFLSACGSEYDEIISIIKNIEFDDEMRKLHFLQEFIKESKAKYSASELYLLNRLEYHIKALSERYAKGVDVQKVEFVNPLER
jgi:hypothetical protein